MKARAQKRGSWGEVSATALVVHPVSLGGYREAGDAAGTGRATTLAPPPDKGMAMGVPVLGGSIESRTELLPRLEAAAREGQRAQYLPPRLDQIEVGGVPRLEDELPARVDQRPEQHVRGAVGCQVVQDDVDAVDARVEPALDPLQEGDDVGGGAPGVGRGQRRARHGHEGAEDVATAAASIVDLLPGPSSPLPVRIAPHQPRAGEAFGALRAHFIEADHDTADGRTGVERDDGPLFAAKAGSGRSPNQVSCFRQRNPSACRISPMRLRFIAMPRSSLRCTASRSNVQLPKGSPDSCGLVRLAATTSPTCSGVYVTGRPERGASASPATPPVLKRSSQRRTTGAEIPNSAAMAGTRCPWAASPTMHARSTRRTGAVRERTRRPISCSSCGERRRTRNSFGTGHLLGSPRSIPLLTGWTTKYLPVNSRPVVCGDGSPWRLWDVRVGVQSVLCGAPPATTAAL